MYEYNTGGFYMKLIKNVTTELRDFGSGLKLKILLDKVTGAKNLDLGTVMIEPNCKTNMHSRTFEEVIYMLSGKGEVITDTDDVYTLDEGDCILIPPGVVHCHANSSDSPLEQLYIFAPQATDDIEESLRNLPIIKD